MFFVTVIIFVIIVYKNRELTSILSDNTYKTDKKDEKK